MMPEHIKQSKQGAWLFMLVGLGIGMFPPVLATLAVMHGNGQNYGFASFVSTHRNEPLIWVLDFLPFLIAFMAWMAAANRAQAERLSAITTDMIESWQRLRLHNSIMRELAEEQARGGVSDFNGFLALVLTKAAEGLSADYAAVFFLENDLKDGRQMLSCPVYFFDKDVHFPEGVLIDACDLPMSFEVLKTSKPVMIRKRDIDTSQGIPQPYRSLSISTVPSTVYTLPVFSEGRTIGTVNFGHLYSQGKWHPEEENFAEAIATYLALLVVELEKQKVTEADKAKSEFLAVMSHELRTPLNAINGFTELIQMESDISRIQEFSGHVKEASDMLMVLINELLDLSQLERGKIKLEISQFNLHRLLNECKTILQNQLEETGKVKMSLCIDPNVPEDIVTDKTRLRQVITNLLNNAAKFTHEGDITLVCQVSDETGDGKVDSLYFEVRDTGIGIPAEKQHVIFEMFTQVNSDLSRNYGGTGIGLAVCKRLVNLMNGVIGVRSVPGQGSTFWFTIRPEHMYNEETSTAGCS